MRAGFGKAELTPPLGVELAGYGYYLQRRAAAVADPLYARALLLEQGEQRALLVSCEVLGLSRPVCDAVIRLQDGVILEQSHADDSFSDGLLEHPQYTKPAQFEGMGVPDVLLSGHHANIRRWRLKQSLERTLQRRPDLLEERAFSEEELSLIDELCLERSKNICGE